MRRWRRRPCGTPSTTAASETSAVPRTATSIPLISDNRTPAFTWLGDGPFPGAERQRLRGIVAGAPVRRQTVRFWATPDTPGPARDALWNGLFAAGVDYINTDDLAGLGTFLDAQERP